MNITKLLGKRILISEQSRHGDRNFAEVKVLEISPSGNWAKLINMYGRKYWKRISALELVEELIDLKLDAGNRGKKSKWIPLDQSVDDVDLIEIFNRPEIILQRIVSAAPLPKHGATIDALKAICANPSKSNISIALHIAKRAEILLGNKSGEARRKLG